MEVLLTQTDLTVKKWLPPWERNLSDITEFASCSRTACVENEFAYSLYSNLWRSARLSFFDRRDRVDVMNGKATQVRESLHEHVLWWLVEHRSRLMRWISRVLKQFIFQWFKVKKAYFDSTWRYPHWRGKIHNSVVGVWFVISLDRWWFGGFLNKGKLEPGLNTKKRSIYDWCHRYLLMSVLMQITLITSLIANLTLYQSPFSRRFLTWVVFATPWEIRVELHRRVPDLTWTGLCGEQFAVQSQLNAILLRLH